MRQFSPFQGVTKIPLLFSAQAHSVPPQTTSSAASALPRAASEEQAPHNADTVSHQGCWTGRGAPLRHCFVFSVVLGAAGAAALNKLNSMEYQSKIFWKPINSSLKVGLAQLSRPPHLRCEAEQGVRLLEQGGRGGGRNHLSFKKIPASKRQEPARDAKITGM